MAKNWRWGLRKRRISAGVEGAIPIRDDTTITPLHQPGAILNPLTEIADERARQMSAEAFRAEGANFVASLIGERLLWARSGPARSANTSDFADTP